MRFLTPGAMHPGWLLCDAARHTHSPLVLLLTAHGSMAVPMTRDTRVALLEENECSLLIVRPGLKVPGHSWVAFAYGFATVEHWDLGNQ